jgi:hypothetical protein
MAHTVIPQTSARLRARISGALYVLCIGCGLFAEMGVRAKLVVYSDAAVTAHNIAAAPGLYRPGRIIGQNMGIPNPNRDCWSADHDHSPKIAKEAGELCCRCWSRDAACRTYCPRSGAHARNTDLRLGRRQGCGQEAIGV